MIQTIKVSSRGQIVIPEDIRKHFRIEQGTRLIVLEQGNKLILERESDFLNEFAEREETEWLRLAQKSMKEIWDNPKDDEVWSRYL